MADPRLGKVKYKVNLQYFGGQENKATLKNWKIHGNQI